MPDTGSDRSNAETARTIFAHSSGSPPAAIAIVRISGPDAFKAVKALIGALPEPNVAKYCALRRPADGDLLDRAIVVTFPGPRSATGEDLAELHLHGGRAIVAAVLEALADVDGFRPAKPGEFTRRAFENGRIDFAEAEGLADLLMAETEAQRRSALALAGGALSRQVEDWRQQLLALSSSIEALLDFSDEDDVAPDLGDRWSSRLIHLLADLDCALARPSAERLKEGVRVVIAGPPNAGKSTLLNMLVNRRAAIVSAVAGTTRDAIEVPVAIEGIPFVFVDTAGLRDSNDEVEAKGVLIAQDQLASADIVLWMGDADQRPDERHVIQVRSKADLELLADGETQVTHVSGKTGLGVDRLVKAVIQRARLLLPAEHEYAINTRQRASIQQCREHLAKVSETRDMLIQAEHLRLARMELDRVTGRAGVEDMLDKLFASFCIGK